MSRAYLESLPEPGNLWGRYRPKAWPVPQAWWTDPIRRNLGDLRLAKGFDGLGLDQPLDDLVWFPPVEGDLDEEAIDVIAKHVARGTPVVQQLRPSGGEAAAGAVGVVDLTETLLVDAGEGATASWSGTISGLFALWPLVRGVSDTSEQVVRGLDRLSRAGAIGVVGIALDLEPKQRRTLADRCSEADFSALFHGELADERQFATAVARAGLDPFLDRPLPDAAERQRNGRWLAGKLAQAADLGARLGRPATSVQTLFRAAREIDRSPRDWIGLAREGNLEVIPWLEGSALELVRQLSIEGRADGLYALEHEYLGTDRPTSISN